MAKIEYTKEQREEMRSLYTACGTATDAASEAARAKVVTDLAAKYGVDPRSIRGVMSRADYYVAKVTKAKDGSPAVRKETLVNRYVELSGVSADRAESLVNATKNALQDLVAFAESVAEEENETEA